MKKLALLNLLLAIGLMGCAESASKQHEVNLDVAGGSSGIVGAEAFSNADVGLRATVALVNLSTQRQMCTGTLISKHLVLTAAHCFAAGTTTNYAVQFYDGSITNISYNLHHQDFRGADDKNDIALLLLEKAAPADIKVAQLPRTALKVGTYKTRAFGIGRTGANNLDSGEMRMVNLQGTVTSSRPQFLLYRQSNGKGVCKGDSGGPHFMYNNGAPILVAITTQAENTRNIFGQEAADYCRRDTVATLTGKYFAWISEAAKILTQDK